MQCRGFGLFCLISSALVASGCDEGNNLTAPTLGTLEITTSTSGTEPDPDGYTVQVGNEPAQAIGASATLQQTEVTPGTHTVQLAGVAANCAVGPQNPQTVTVTAGSTTTVVFTITCSPTTGGLQVTTSTTGPTDPDGYLVAVDGVERGSIGGNGSLSLADLTSGPHTVGLGGVAANCAVESENPRNVSIPGGGTTTVVFTVACAEPPPSAGAIHITTATTGSDPDPDGYSFTVDGAAAQPIGTSAEATLANVTAGTHLVQLGGLAATCVVQGSNPQSVTVSAGATASVSFAIVCAASTGRLDVTASTSGSDLDPNGYSLILDGGDAQAIGINETRIFSALATGGHTVRLEDLAPNCAVQGDNPQSVNVSAGTPATVTFTISCSEPPAAQAMIAVQRDVAVFVVNPDGTGLRKLADGTVPSWSPDRTRVAFFNQGLWVINSDGTGQADLSRDLSQDLRQRILPEQAQWSPDGSMIAFEIDASPEREGCCPVDIWLARTDGSGAVRLVDNGSSPAWSPDGRRIAFESPRDGNDEIYVINTDGTGLTRLTNRDGFDLSPSWSPDGQRIAFETGTLGGSFDVGVMNADGTGVVNLTQGSGGGFLPVWVQGGSKIGFRSGDQIALINPDGTGRFTVIEEDGMHRGTAWSPDGRRVAFVKNVDRGGPVVDPELFVVDAEGTGLHNVSNSPGVNESNPDW